MNEADFEILGAGGPYTIRSTEDRLRDAGFTVIKPLVPDDAALRVKALELAICRAKPEESAVEFAEKFYKFLKGNDDNVTNLHGQKQDER
jgi:hypothetical protein